MNNKRTAENVWIVGAGRVGRLIAAAERKKESLVVLFGTEFGTSRIGTHRFQVNDEIRSGEPDRIWFCVPDDKLVQAIEQWQLAGVKPKIALHTSGWHSPNLLQPLFDGNDEAEYVSFHPMRSLLGKNADEWKGAVVNLAGTPEAIYWAKGFCELIGCKPIVVRPEEKKYIHLVCQLAANMPFAIVAAIEQLSAQTSLTKGILAKAVREMIVNSTDNALRLGATAAATGPVARGDTQTVRNALAALEPYPELRAFYEAYAKLFQAAMEREKQIV